MGADIEDADGGADPVRRLLLLQGVEQRVIDVGRVVDDLDAVFEAERNRLGGAGVRGQPLAARVRDLGGGGDLVLGHGDVAAAPARPLAESVARGRYLDHIHALADHLAHGAPHRLGAVAHVAEGLVVHVHLADIAVARGADQLGTGGAHPRPRGKTGVDLIADDDVEARLGAAGADDGGEAVVQDGAGVAERVERMLLGRHLADIAQPGGVGVADVAVAVDHPRHQRRAVALDDLGILARDLVRALGHRFDPIAPDQHLAAVGLASGAVEDRYVGEQPVGHRRSTRRRKTRPA